MATGAMTLADLRNEISKIRFNDPSNIGSIDRWINFTYAKLWGLENWIFRRATDTLPIVAGTRAVAFGGARGFVPVAVWDTNGNRLAYLDYETFSDVYLPDTTTGTPI